MLGLIDDEICGTVTISPCSQWFESLIDDDFVYGELSPESECIEHDHELVSRVISRRLKPCRIASS